MQCPSCAFYNLPGSVVCGRCSSVLRPNSLAIDIEPPRATASAKYLRRIFPGRIAYRLRDELYTLRRQVRRSVDQVGFVAPPSGTIGRMVVPGSAHMHIGERERGRLFMGSYFGLLLPAIAFYGSLVGSLALGLAFGVHAASCLSVLRRGGITTVASRLTAAAISAAILLIALYLPAGYVVSRYAEPLWFNYAAEPFAAGDVLILNPRAFVNSAPQPGDVVRYQQGYRQLGIPGFGPNYVVGEGAIIDRVLAGPGDQVRWEHGRLSVNGQDSPHLPLNPQRLPDALKWQVPEDFYLILPTTSVALQARLTGEVWQQLGLVRRENIIGRVYFRTQPLTRWGRIH